MGDILKEILKIVPAKKVSTAGFEGANIVLYTKDKQFFFDNEGLIRKIVNEFKKRVELRPDPSICMELEKAEKQIKKLIPKEAGISQIIFDSQRSMVIIEAEKPGLAIGKQGSILREVREKIKEHNCTSFLVTKDNNKLLGIITNRDITFIKDDEKLVKDLMTPKGKLITAPYDINTEQAKEILKNNKIEKLPLVDNDFNIKGLITSADIITNYNNVNC